MQSDSGVPDWVCDTGPKENDNNYPIAIHPEGNLAITVEGGTRATGIPSESPASRNRKGKSTKRMVAQNQLSFWDVRPDLAPLALETWILLLYMDKASYRARAELSLPLGLDNYGRASYWAERIIIPLDDIGFVISRDDHSGSNEGMASNSGSSLIRRID